MNKGIVAIEASLRKHLFDAQSRHFSLIPLIGGNDPTTGKRPALASWKAYQTQHATETEIEQWLADGMTAYGVVCGQISGLIVLDIDDSDVAAALARRFPRLMNTYIVQSGLRGTPHLYYRVDFPVQSQAILGGDLKAEGSYVVGAGSEIAGRMWQVENDTPIRPITQAQLERILTVLRPAPQTKSTFQVEGNNPDESIKTKPPPHHHNVEGGNLFSTSTIISDSPMLFTYRDAAAIYRANVSTSQQRNNSLFNIACYLRDRGYSKDWTLDALAKIHANEAPRLDQKQESYTRRLREAIGTINSAYTRPPRSISFGTVPSDSQPTSRLAGSIREALLARPQKDGTAILRTLEGLYLMGWSLSTPISVPEATRLLTGYVGRRSILRAFAAMVDDEECLFDALPARLVPFCPPNKEAGFCSDAEPFCSAQFETVLQVSQSASAWGLSGGKSLAAQHYRVPTPPDLFRKLAVEPSAGDPITLDDISSAKAYRAALQREFINRRPGCYAQSMLADRLRVSDRTIRRYHADSPVQSRACYTDEYISWFNINHLPTKADAAEFGRGGCFLMDQTGKRYPAFREIACKLLAKRKKLMLRTQTVNFYWCGDHEPVAAEAILVADGYEKQTQLSPSSLPVKLPLSGVTDVSPAKDKPATPPAATITNETSIAKPVVVEPLDHATLEEPTTVVHQSNLLLPVSEIIYVKPYTPPQAAAPKKRQRCRTKRKFRYPLEDVYAEKIAHQVHEAIPTLSLANARRLVDTYGAGVVKRTLGRVIWLDEKQRATNPAGLLIASVGVAWRHQHGWDVPKPVFKAEPKRKGRRKKYDPRKDPITKSEAWLRWSIQFWYERGDMEAVEWRQIRLVELGFAPEVLGDYGGGEEIGEIDFF